MTWLNPAAFLAIAIVAVPPLIHLLVHRHAERLPFPTLRFIQPTRLAAMRRHVLEDIVLLAVRTAIIAAAILALAAPLAVTAARRAVWSERIVRAVVVDDRGDSSNDRQAEASGDALVFRVQEFRAKSLADGVDRAIAWLDAAPPARRELVIAGPLTIGSIHHTDIASVPADIGIRFRRTATPPLERTVEAVPSIASAGLVRRTVTLSQAHTTIRQAVESADPRVPIEVVAAADQHRAIQAAIDAVRAEHFAEPKPDRRVKLLVLDPGRAGGGDGAGEPIRMAWMADAVARVARDSRLQQEAARTTARFQDSRLGTAPWQALVAGADGRPLIFAAASAGTLVIATVADAAALFTPVLLRSLTESVASSDDATAAEVALISDAVLRAWTRAPAAVVTPRLDNMDEDDRRWWWVAVLLLLAIETWIRRARRDEADIAVPEATRVA